MLRPEEVEAVVGLYEFGWGTKRIAEEFGCSRNTVKRYVATAGWVPYSASDTAVQGTRCQVSTRDHLSSAVSRSPPARW